MILSDRLFEVCIFSFGTRLTISTFLQYLALHQKLYNILKANPNLRSLANHPNRMIAAIKETLRKNYLFSAFQVLASNLHYFCI